MMKKLGSGMKKKLLLFFLIIVNIPLFLWVPVYAYQWQLATEVKNTSYFIDTEEISMGRLSVTFFVMNVSNKTGEVKSIKKCTINCGDSIIAIREVARQGFLGGVEKTSYEYDLMWYDISPNSATESIEKKVCEGGRPRQDLKEYFSEPHIQGLAEPCCYRFRQTGKTDIEHWAFFPLISTGPRYIVSTDGFSSLPVWP